MSSGICEKEILCSVGETTSTFGFTKELSIEPTVECLVLVLLFRDILLGNQRFFTFGFV